MQKLDLYLYVKETQNYLKNLIFLTAMTKIMILPVEEKMNLY